MNQPKHIVFCLCAQLPLFCIASALEVFRHANRFSGKTVYRWTFLCENNEPIQDSNGLWLHPGAKIEDVNLVDAAFVVAGFNPLKQPSTQLKRFLIKEAKAGRIVGSISNGAFLLAESGLLEGRNATTHWEDFESFCVLYPQVRSRYQRFVIDENRMTCSGGTSTLDMFLEIVRRDFGNEVVLKISRQMLLRDFVDPPGSAIKPVFDGAYHYSPRVQRALSLLDAGIEHKVNVELLARQSGLGRRELLRLFQKEIGMTPSSLLMQRKLERARSLILQTHLPIATIAAAVGYSSQAHLSESYRKNYSITPARHRREYRQQFPGQAV